MTELLVDLVIAVHHQRRRVARAVATALEQTNGLVRVTVVCHGIRSERIEPELAKAGVTSDAGTVRLLELNDGVPSPAGPFNLGLDAATARYVAIMGSDDLLEPGAIRGWLDVAEKRGSAAVIAPLRQEGGALLRNPLTRPFAGHVWPYAGVRLSPVRDRMAYRSAPLGLIRTSVVQELSLRLTPGLRTGEDLAFSTQLWFSGLRVDLARTAPAYVIGADAADRVSMAPMALAEELAGVVDLRERPWVEELSAPARRALAIKILRIHVLGAVARRAMPELWAEGDVEVLRVVAASWLDLAPGALRPFARSDRVVLDAVLSPGAGAAELVAAAGVRAEAAQAVPARPASLVPARVRDVLDREGTLRRYARYRMWW